MKKKELHKGFHSSLLGANDKESNRICSRKNTGKKNLDQVLFLIKLDKEFIFKKDIAQKKLRNINKKKIKKKTN